MKEVYYIETDNNVLTTFYLDIIKEALSKLGFNIKRLQTPTEAIIKKVPRKAWFLTTGHKNVTKLTLLGYKNIINWFQGLPSEEDFLITRNKFRYQAINLLDNITFRCTKYGFYVSQEQIDYFKEKFKFTPQNTFIMPCFNETIKESAFSTPNKYVKNTFCYVGTTGAWQRFNDIVALYAKLEQHDPNCFFKILTPDTEDAKRLIELHNVKNYSIKCVPGDQVSKEIADCKFGFIIRNNSIINQVATPTKFCNYLSNGLIPIISDTIRSYSRLAETNPYIIVVNDDNAYDTACEQLCRHFSAQEVLNAHRQTFNSYFNRSLYVEQITASLKEFFKNQEQVFFQ